MNRTEWTDPFNSFNSWKGLMYKKHYDSIAKGILPPPVEASIDPSYLCNVDCIWCNSRRILHTDLASQLMTEEHLERLCNFLIEWGVEGFCFAGGGEPTLNPALWNVLRNIKSSGRQSAIITNGIAMNTRQKRETAAQTCRWIGFSLDAATPECFSRVKCVDPGFFDVVIDNIASVADIVREQGLQCELAVKYLIHPENTHEIAAACAIAKELGVAHFHARPAASENIEGQSQVLNFDMDEVNEQLEECLAMQTDNFKVFGVRHKFSPTFNVEHGFSRCISAPLCIQCGADGNVYLCNDWRGNAKFRLGAHYPNPEQILDFWGSQAHIDLMRSINVDKCPRCTYGIYAKQIEHAVEEDAMCYAFP